MSYKLTCYNIHTHTYIRTYLHLGQGNLLEALQDLPLNVLVLGVKDKVHRPLPYHNTRRDINALKGGSIESTLASDLPVCILIEEVRVKKHVVVGVCEHVLLRGREGRKMSELDGGERCGKVPIALKVFLYYHLVDFFFVDFFLHGRKNRSTVISPSKLVRAPALTWYFGGLKKSFHPSHEVLKPSGYQIWPFHPASITA